MTDNRSAAPDGTVELRGGRHVITFERRLKHPVERVWRALTEPLELEAWLARAKLDLEQGGRIELAWRNSDDEGNQAVLHGRITRLEAPTLIEYEGDIHGTLRWELSPAEGGCLLRFSSTLPPLDDELLPKVLSGWHSQLDFLEEALEGERVDWPNWRCGERAVPASLWSRLERWDEHHARYSRRVTTA